MLNKHEVLTTSESNQLLLPPGRITVNRDNWGIRIHDGEVLGGYEIPTVRAHEPPLGPGPTTHVAGTMDAGFFGEVTGEELITYEGLATEVGVSEGISQFNAESTWLKFALDNKILYVAKKPIRDKVTWRALNTANVIYENTTNITVGTNTFDVTLLRGAATDPTPVPTGFNLIETHGSEWNRLMFPIHSVNHTTGSVSRHNDPTAEPFESWATYLDEDLITDVDVGEGAYTLCQELRESDSGRCVTRGSEGVMYMIGGLLGYTHYGWRPCLRLVS